MYYLNACAMSKYLLLIFAMHILTHLQKDPIKYISYIFVISPAF